MSMVAEKREAAAFCAEDGILRRMAPMVRTHRRLFLVTGGLAILGFVVLTLRRLRGYWIEHASLSFLQAEEGDFAVVYHEGSRELMFLGVERPKSEVDVLFVPPETSWTSRVEPWARSRRAQILDRLLRHPFVRRCEIRPSSLP